MWLRDELREIEKYLIDLIKVVAERAESDIDYNAGIYPLATRTGDSSPNGLTGAPTNYFLAYKMEPLAS